MTDCLETGRFVWSAVRVTSLLYYNHALIVGGSRDKWSMLRPMSVGWLPNTGAASTSGRRTQLSRKEKIKTKINNRTEEEGERTRRHFERTSRAANAGRNKRTIKYTKGERSEARHRVVSLKGRDWSKLPLDCSWNAILHMTVWSMNRNATANCFLAFCPTSCSILNEKGSYYWLIYILRTVSLLF